MPRLMVVKSHPEHCAERVSVLFQGLYEMLDKVKRDMIPESPGVAVFYFCYCIFCVYMIVFSAGLTNIIFTTVTGG